jgi:hypothetical protein
MATNQAEAEAEMKKMFAAGSFTKSDVEWLEGVVTKIDTTKGHLNNLGINPERKPILSLRRDLRSITRVIKTGPGANNTYVRRDNFNRHIIAFSGDMGAVTQLVNLRIEQLKGTITELQGLVAEIDKVHQRVGE